MPESLKQKTIISMIWSGIERFSTAGTSFLFGLVMARLLKPSDYGMIAMLGIFIAISQTFIDSGFSSALIRKPNRTEADNATAFYFNIIVGLVCYLALFFTAPYIARFYNTPQLTILTRIIALNLILNSLCVVQQALLTIKLDFKTQAKISLSGVILSGITGIFLAYKGLGVWALVVQSVFSSVIRTILLWKLAKWHPQAPFSHESFHYLFSFGSKILTSGLLDTIYNNIYTIVIGKKFSSSKLGLYARADQWAQFPSVNITGILQRVSFPVLSTMQNEDERLSINYRKILRLSGFIIFPMMTGMAAIADPLIRIILTDKWAGTIPLLQILCFSLMWYPIHAINLNLLQVKGRSDLFLKLEIYKKILGVGILCITIPLGLIAMCIGQVISSILCLALNTHYTGLLIHLGFLRQMKDLFPTLTNSLIMGGLVFVSIHFIPSLGLKLIAGIFIGIAYYILSNLLFRTMEWNEFISIIKHR
jgi:O-antigen/teichoic acid export membrane protein